MSLAVHAASAPAGELLLFFLEISHPDWPAPLRYAEDAIDWTVTLENSEEATFTSTGLEAEAGSSDDSGVDMRSMRVPDPDLVLCRLIESVIGSLEPIRVILRSYLSTDLSAPVQVAALDMTDPLQGPDRSISFEANTANTMNRGAPTERYTLQNSPGLRA